MKNRVEEDFKASFSVPASTQNGEGVKMTSETGRATAGNKSGPPELGPTSLKYGDHGTQDGGGKMADVNNGATTDKSGPPELGPTSLKWGDRVAKIAGIVDALKEVEDAGLDQMLDLLSSPDMAEETVTEGEFPDFLKKKKGKDEDSDDADDSSDDEDENADDEDKKKKTCSEAENRLAAAATISRADLDLTEDTAAMFAGSELTEEFKAKAADVFGAVIVTKVNEQLGKMQRIMESDMTIIIDERIETLTEKLDHYLNYVVTEWLDDNKLAVEHGLQAELTEEFMSGLQQLFKAHYIHIPNQKVEVVEALANKLEEATHSLDQEIAANVDLTEKIERLEREKISESVCRGLTDLEISKLKPIIESMEFSTAQTFRQSVKNLRESYFPKTKTGAIELSEGSGRDLDEQPIDGSNTPQTNAVMDKYSAAIRQSLKK